MKILHNIHGIRHAFWSLIAVGHNLRGQKDGNWQTKVMTQMFLMWGHYADSSQANVYKQQIKKKISL